MWGINPHIPTSRTAFGGDRRKIVRSATDAPKSVPAMDDEVYQQTQESLLVSPQLNRGRFTSTANSFDQRFFAKLC
jgi:hypothetical protein